MNIFLLFHVPGWTPVRRNAGVVVGAPNLHQRDALKFEHIDDCIAAAESEQDEKNNISVGIAFFLSPDSEREICKFLNSDRSRFLQRRDLFLSAPLTLVLEPICQSTGGLKGPQR